MLNEDEDGERERERKGKTRLPIAHQVIGEFRSNSIFPLVNHTGRSVGVSPETSADLASASGRRTPIGHQ